jgi:transcriptional regulator with XRE-family HTH domain
MSTKRKFDFHQDLSIDRLIEDYEKDPDNARRVREAEIRLELSEFMRSLRESCDLTQTDLARLVGKTQPLIAKLEAGAYDRMGFSGVRTYARAMGVDFVDVKHMFQPIAEETQPGVMSAEHVLPELGVDALAMNWAQRGASLTEVFEYLDPAQRLVAA